MKIVGMFNFKPGKFLRTWSRCSKPNILLSTSLSVCERLNSYRAAEAVLHYKNILIVNTARCALRVSRKYSTPVTDGCDRASDIVFLYMCATNGIWWRECTIVLGYIRCTKHIWTQLVASPLLYVYRSVQVGAYKSWCVHRKLFKHCFDGNRSICNHIHNPFSIHSCQTDHQLYT